MRTILLGLNSNSSGLSTSANRYCALNGWGRSSSGWSSTLGGAAIPFSIPGTLQNLQVNFPVALTGAQTYIITVRNQSGPSSVTCTVDSSGLQASDIYSVTGHRLTVAAGDLIEINVTPSGTPTAQTYVQISADFIATTSGESMLLFGSSGLVSNSATTYNGLGNGPTWNATEAVRDVVVPCDGTIDYLYFSANLAPGAGTSYTAVVRKAGVDTTLTATIANTSADATPDTTHSFTVVKGDIVSISCTPSGSPTARSVGGSVRFVPVVSGSTAIMGGGGNPSTGLVRYLSPAGTTTNEATEANCLALVPFACDWVKMFANHDTAPGSGKSREYRSRINAVDGTVVAVVSNTSTSGSDVTNTDTLARGDLISIQTTPSGTPTSPGNIRLSFVMYVAPTGGYNYVPDLRRMFI